MEVDDKRIEGGRLAGAIAMLFRYGFAWTRVLVFRVAPSCPGESPARRATAC
jgi:hypothetical protein